MLPAGEIFPAPRSFQPEGGKMFPVPKAVEITGKSSFALEAAAEVLKNHLVAFPEHSSGAITLEVNADQLPEEDGYSWQMDPEKKVKEKQFI